MKVLHTLRHMGLRIRDLQYKASPALSPDQQLQATQLALFSAAMLILTFISLTLQLIFVGYVGVSGAIAVPITLILLSIHLLSRTRHYLVGAVLAVVMAFVIGLATLLTYRTATSALIMIFSILIASLFFHARFILVLTVLNALTLIVVSMMVPGNWNYQVGILMFHTLMTGCVLAINRGLRQRAEQFWRWSETRYRHMFHNSRAVQLFIDPKTGHIADANKAAVQFYGYTLEELKGKPIYELNQLPRGDVTRAMHSISGSSGAIFEFEHRLASGEIRSVDVFSCPVSMPGATYLHSIIMDASDKRRAEERRNRLLNYLSFLNETAMTLPKLPDEESIYTYIGTEIQHLLKDAVVLVNRNSADGRMTIQGAYGVDDTRLDYVAEIMGYSPVGMTYATNPEIIALFSRGDLVHIQAELPELAENVLPEAIARQIAALLDIQSIYLIGIRKGDWLYAGVQIYMRGPHHIDEPEIIEAFVQQASSALQRMQAIEALRASERQYRALFEQSNDAVFILDMDGNHLAVNQRAADMLGYTPEEIIGLDRHQIIIPMEFDHSDSVMERMLAGERVPPYERLFRHKDGHVVSVEVNVEIVRDAHGTPIHIQSIARDITERKQQEAEQQAFLYDMTALQEVHLRLSELNDMQMLLRQTVQMAHERMGLDRVALFLLDEDGTTLHGTYGTDIHGKLRNESYYSEPITRAHWSRMAISGPNHMRVWEDADLYDDGQVVGKGWKAAAPLWTGNRVIGYMITDNMLTGRSPRSYEFELISVLGSTFGHLIDGLRLAEALRQSEARYRGVVESQTDMVCRYQPDSTLTFVNPAYCRYFGKTTAELIGTSFLDLIPPEQRKDVSAHYLSLLLNPRVTEYEHISTAANGESRWQSWIDKVIQDDSGRVIEIQAVGRDITQRKRAEEALRLSEARQRAMLEALPDMIFRNRIDGTYIDYHAPDEALLFAPPEVFLGKKIVDVLPSPLAESYIRAIAQAINTGEMIMDEYTLPVNGQPRQFEMRLVPAGGDEVIIVVRDVTELRQAQRDLERAKSRLEFTVDAARIAWWEMDIETGEVHFDSRRVTMAGYDDDDFARQQQAALDALIHPDDYPAVRQAINNLITEKTPSYEVDYRFRKADGGWLWYHDRGELTVSPEGHRAIHGFVIDISARKEMEQRELEFILERERVHLLTNFIEKAAHEFHTPLSIINSSAFLLSRTTDPEKRQTYVERIEEHVMRTARLVGMLLKMAELEGKEKIEHRLVDLNNVVDTVCQQVQLERKAGPALHVNIAAQPHPVIGNVNYLTDALHELLDNAYRFTPAEGHIHVTLKTADDHIILEIDDTGVGISDDNLSYIFDTFWRNDEAHSTPGFGLGLPIARRVIELHHGHIDVHSVEGQGTLFRIVLPAAETRSLLTEAR